MKESLVEKQVKRSAEVLVETLLIEGVKVAEAYAESKGSTLYTQLVVGLKLIKKALIDDLVNKIDGEAG